MTAPHLPPDTPMPPTAVGVWPLGVELGVAAGHRVVLLSLERWEAWADLRFARIDLTGEVRLPRRVPTREAWRVRCDGRELTVYDAVGRGDRWFSNGEVRLTPPPGPGARLTVAVTVTGDTPALEAEVLLPGA